MMIGARRGRRIIYVPLAAMAAFAVLNQPLLFLGAAGASAVIAAWGIRINLPKFIRIPAKSDLYYLKRKLHKSKIKPITQRRVADKKSDRRKMAHGILKAEHFSPNTVMTMASIFLKLRIAKKLERWMIGMIKTAIFESGAIEDSRRIAHYSISLAFLTMPPTLAGGILLGIFVSPVFFAIAGVPAAFLMSGVINLRITRSQRKNAISHELPIFIMCTSIMEQVGFNLYAFLEKLSRTKTTLFPTIQRDARLFMRNTAFLAMPPEKALKRIADVHPNQQFKDLVSDYTSARMTSGASTANTMMSATESSFRNMRFRIKAYEGTAQGMAQILLLMMATAPIMTIASSLVATGSSALHLTMLMLLLMPMMSIMIMIMIDGQQPRTHNTAGFAREGIVIAAITVTVMAVLGRPAWEIMGISVAVFAGINSFRNLGHFRMLASLDKAMPKFLEEVTDGMTEGMTIYESIKRKANHPNKPLRKILSTISKKMYMGKRLVVASEEVQSQSWLSHVVLFVLGHIHESGAASAQILRTFSNFTKDYQESKQELLSGLRGVIGMGYFIPILMGFMLVVASQLVTSITGDLGDIEHLPIAIPTVRDAEALTESAFVLVVMCSALIGFVVSKIAYFTVQHTLHVCIMSVMAVILCHIVPFVPPFF